MRGRRRDAVSERSPGRAQANATNVRHRIEASSMDERCTHAVGHLATGRHINVDELEASRSRRRLGHIEP